MPHDSFPLSQEICIFLVSAGLIVPFFKHVRINPVLGFLLTGMLVGPFGLGSLVVQHPWLSPFTIAEPKNVSSLAEWGIIFLMFTIGLELSLNRLWRMRRLVFGLGTVQILLSGTLIGLFAYAWGNSMAASLVLGGCLALSSTAIVLQLIDQKGQLGSAFGQTNIAILLMQDLAVVPILLLVTLFGEQSIAQLDQTAVSAVTPNNLWLILPLTLLKAVLVLLAIYGVGRKILQPLLHMVAKSKTPELFLATTLLIIVLSANITGMAGLSMALGAFLAGLLIAETEFRHTIEVDIEPFKGLLLGLFFMTVGMGIDLSIIGEYGILILASVIGLITLKTATTSLSAWLFKIPWSVGLPVGVMLSQGGEFAFVVVGLAVHYQLLPTDVGYFMLLLASCTMVLTPLLSRIADRLGAAMEHHRLQLPLAINQAKPQHELEPHFFMGHQANPGLAHTHGLQQHIIVAGFGRMARVLCRSLGGHSVPYIALENNPEKLVIANTEKLPVFYGDATRTSILKKAEIASARILVITIMNGHEAEALVKKVKKLWPKIYILARARDVEHAQQLMNLGADDVVLEIIEASLQISAIILKRLGLSQGSVQHHIDQVRSEENPHL